MIGKTLSHYKVIEKIGQGGMGEVYRAEDTNLSREVAIKVLPEQFTKDPQRLARFEREAKLLAQLNHPNIAAIYGLEEAEGVRFLALELVPGETLAERVAKGPVPVEEALEVCRQIAEGMEAAHEKGVIHRDLKPANVKVTPEGKVKILDFGLAKAFEEETPVTDISQSPTMTEEMTRAGMILGTAAYMSPEQAKGKPVDKRADVFAFGAVLYELLTGKRAFEGETITETIAAVLKSEPDWEKLPETTPWRIQELLRRCLTKDAHDRLRDIANVRVEIKLALSEPATAAPMSATDAVRSPRWQKAIPWGIAGVVVIVGFAWWSLTPPAPKSLRKFMITPRLDAPLGNFDSNDLTISPDGTEVVYLAQSGDKTQLYVRRLDDFASTPIPGTEGAREGGVLVSPDGESLVFFSGGTVKRVSLRGGEPTTLSQASRWRGGSWVGDTIVFSAQEEVSDRGQSLFRISASGGQTERLASPDPNKGERSFYQPEILPGEKEILFSVFRGAYRNEIRALSLETGEQKLVLEGGKHPRYLPTGHLVYGLRDTQTLMAVPFNLEALEVRGASVPVLEGIRSSRDSEMDYSISQDGTLTYISGWEEQPPSRLVWVDRQGEVELLREMESQSQAPRFSPEGSHLAVQVREGGPLDANIWIYEMAREVLTPVTEGRFNSFPVWTPDGDRLTFHTHTDQEALFWISADASGEAEEIMAGPLSQIPNSYSREGVLAYSLSVATGDADLWVLPPEVESKPREFLATPYSERQAMFSPDGHWIAFTSDRAGQDEIYVTAYPEGGTSHQVSIGGGREPDVKRPSLLFEGTFDHNLRVSNYDVTPDGQRFVMVQTNEVERPPTQIHVILNWFEELKRLVPAN